MVAEDAYPQSCQIDKSSCEFLQKQLLDIFCDELFHDYLRMKIMRVNSKNCPNRVVFDMNRVQVFPQGNFHVPYPL